ncbi:polysaccharide deacetylase family protein [Ornithinibacillus halotolerans]|uniref:Polysaccharide deacetylase n=1 Tax=Ornithinibacillus halotolerans TaxID=1274357 RepID=A0A916RW09_9BACI|nr:hypothetical protein [Ornithinibacillus halotolerans]GGA72900.1 hypothetical protein GCM10008025_15850 [Ornithinibacillus halotolerans]
MNTVGKFVISLDLELNWGVFDVFTLEEYGENLLGVREVVPQLLERFTEHEIKATWGIVGFLFYSTKEELLSELPINKPNYQDQTLSSYHLMKSIGKNETVDPYHYGANLIQQIKQSKNQEIATHTLSHYYCLAKGQDIQSFEEDLLKAVQLARENEIEIKTIIFPRNQLNIDYLPICRKHHLNAYRGNEEHWLYRAEEREGLFKRAIRLMDNYVNISGHHIYSFSDLTNHHGIVNVPSSRFLRPYSPKTSVLESWKLKRIKSGMTKAAKKGKMYHLWWHPHNFGVHISQNMELLDSIINHFHILKRQYGMENVTMQEVSESVLKNSREVTKSSVEKLQ